MGINAIVGQSGGPTCVINSSLAGVFSACRKHGVQHVYGMRHGVQGLLKDDVVNLTDVLSAPGQLTLLRHTPASYLGSCRYKLPESDQMEAVYQEIFDVLRRYDIGYFFYIGGNDSMDTILKLSDYAAKVGSDIRFIGVPKTIDNDLTHTDHTPGYGSAAKYIGTTIKELVRDSTIYDLKSVTIVEIMGRNAGWLTAAAALAEDEDCEGAAMICLPEIPFDPDHFIARVDAIQQQTPSLVVAVSEGVRIADGRYVCELAHTLSERHRALPLQSRRRQAAQQDPRRRALHPPALRRARRQRNGCFRSVWRRCFRGGRRVLRQDRHDGRAQARERRAVCLRL